MPLSPESVACSASEALHVSDTVRSILKRKGGQVWSLAPEATVYDAVALMAEKGVGALMVVSGGKLVGVVSERDYARKVILKGKHSKDTLVAEIMSSPVITVNCDATVAECMRLITANRIRHVPVMHEGELMGVVSVGDLIATLLSAQAETIHQMTKYVTGAYPA